MVSAEIIKRFVAQIKNKHHKINELTIEKDFYLTLLLNEISKSIEEDKSSPFCKLVFKGGTLLTRAHLNYHRLSEDLDFTYLENKKLNSLSSKQRKKVISNFTDQLVEEINKISKKFNLDFSVNKADKKYCKVMDRKKVYLFRIYYQPVYGAEEFIKFEVNFNDELIYPFIFGDIKHLFSIELIKDLEFTEGIKIKIRKNIPCYDLKEISAEKIRAILTRPVILKEKRSKLTEGERKQKKKESDERYYYQNREKIILQKKLWTQRNKGHRKEWKKQHRLEQLGKIRQQDRIQFWRKQQKALALRMLENEHYEAYKPEIFNSVSTYPHAQLLYFDLYKKVFYSFSMIFLNSGINSFGMNIPFFPGPVYLLLVTNSLMLSPS